jgi:hypothetical protein
MFVLLALIYYIAVCMYLSFLCYLHLYSLWQCVCTCHVCVTCTYILYGSVYVLVMFVLLALIYQGVCA